MNSKLCRLLTLASQTFGVRQGEPHFLPPAGWFTILAFQLKIMIIKIMMSRCQWVGDDSMIFQHPLYVVWLPAICGAWSLWRTKIFWPRDWRLGELHHDHDGDDDEGFGWQKPSKSPRNRTEMWIVNEFLACADINLGAFCSVVVHLSGANWILPYFANLNMVANFG